MFLCPICGYRGEFLSFNPPTGLRLHAQCPSCKSLERHRLQYLVFKEVIDETKVNQLSFLHFAPENFFKAKFNNLFSLYHTADLMMKDVDYSVDICDLPFLNQSYDVVYASHVLEHIKDDLKALSEIKRIIKPGGFAILPVPIVSLETIEYPQPLEEESFHVRAPGYDYFDRYKTFFKDVKIYSSKDFLGEHQLFVYENRNYLQKKYREPMQGKKHIDFVPVCFV